MSSSSSSGSGEGLVAFFSRPFPSSEGAVSQFATIEATLVLGTVARRYGMGLVDDHPVVPDPTFTLRPKHGVRVVLRRRG